MKRRADNKRDKSHVDHVEKWAKYVRDHPRSEWIKEVKPLVDSQIIMANRFYERLSKEKGGMEKISRIRGAQGDKISDLDYMGRISSKSALTLREDDAFADKASASAAKKLMKSREKRKKQEDR